MRLQPDSSAILKQVRESPSNRIKVAATDIDGVLRGKYLNKDKFLSAVDSGFGFCNVIFGWDSSDVCYDNSGYTGWHTGYPDALAKIDLRTHREIPWEHQTPFFLADFEGDSGKPLAVCPRQLLKKVIRDTGVAGYTAKVGMEFEWFNFRETPQSLADKGGVDPQPITPGMFGYSLLRASLNQPFLAALMDDLQKFKIPIEGLHTETGPGVLEAALLYSDPLEAADRGVLFKTACKEIGYRFGILPSFMAKWNAALPGCSGHTHQSLWDLAGSQNQFFDERDPDRMSSLFKSYLAGQMHCVSEILPFFAPNVNSYKRLVDGFWAPTQVAWGIDNRTTSFRVINGGGAKAVRLETRVPGSDINPYLVIAACLASGLYGVRKNLTLESQPSVGSAYGNKAYSRLPRNLHQATLRLRESRIARELFGDEFVDHFVNTRIWEWRQFEDSVTHWELKRYFEII